MTKLGLNAKVLSFRVFLLGLLCMIQNVGMTLGKERTSFSYESYQHNIVCTASVEPFEPQSISDIQDIVKSALESNGTVKALGNLHSITDCFCTTGIPIKMNNINHASYDPSSELVTVGTGSTLYALQETLHELGRALTDAPSYGDITVGGALGTGAHGTSLRNPSTLSDQLASVTIVDGRGNVRTIEEGDVDFDAFRVHLGLIGILYEVKLKTVPQYKLHVHNYPARDDILWKEGKILELARNNDRFQFWWFPSSKSVVLSEGNRVPSNEPGNCETHFISDMPKPISVGMSMTLELMQKTRDRVGFHLIQEYARLGLYKEVPGRDPVYSDENTGVICSPFAVGFSHRMVTNKCEECFWKQGPLSLLDDDANIAIPLEQLPFALETIRQIVIDEYEAEFPLNGIYFRFLTPSNAYVAINSGGEMLSVEWITVPRHDKSTMKLGLPAYQSIGQALIAKHQGRPHWGKNGLCYSSPEILLHSHPRLPDFIRVMREVDPDGVFLNDLGRRILFQSTHLTVNPALRTHCALSDVCFCKTDRDCGSNRNLLFSSTCGTLLEYKVCKEKSLLGLGGLLGTKITPGISQTRQVISKLIGNGSDPDRIFNELSKYKMLEPIFTKK